MSGPSSGDPADVRTVLHHERLLPAPWVWFGAALLAGLSSVVAVPLGPTPALVTAAVAFVGGVVLLISWSPVIQVADGELVAGNAHIPARLIGTTTVLDATETRAELGPRLDARAHLCIRGWIRTSVRAALVDPDDPTPYWIISTRRPEALADALGRARAGAGQAG